MKQQRWWSPRLWPAHLLLLVLVAAATGLGLWQFGGWQEAREQAAVDRTLVEPVPLADVLGPDQPFPHDALSRPVVVDGTWVTDGTVVVTDRPGGKVWAVTPLAVGAPDGPALLVVRGAADSVEEVPPPPTGSAELVVWLQPPEGQVGVSDDDRTDDVIPQLRMADALQHVDQDLYGGFGVVADRVAPGAWPVGDRAVNPGTDGLEQVQPPQAPPVGWTTAARNFFYGLEWWVFGLFAIVVWFQWVRDRVRSGDAVRSQA